MARLIEHLVEPNRLLLYWQARESQQRSRYYVGQLIKVDDKVLLQYQSGREMVAAREAGFQGFPAFSLKQVEHSHQVLEAFIRRLPPRTRRDFSRYLELKALPNSAAISDFALLGYSGAKLPDDGFELVHPFDDPPQEFEVLVEIAGFRYESKLKISEIEIGDAIQFEPEPENTVDASAIRMMARGRKLGYVPRCHLDMLHRMLAEGAEINGEVYRVNGTSDRPLVYVLTQIYRVNSLERPRSLKLQA